MIRVTWSRPTTRVSGAAVPADSGVSGYLLLMRVLGAPDFTPVHEGQLGPEVTQFEVDVANAPGTYQFELFAYNEHGASQPAHTSVTIEATEPPPPDTSRLVLDESTFRAVNIP